MASLKPYQIVLTVVALLLLGILLPIGLSDLTAFTSTNSDIQTLVSEVIPIIAVVGIVMALIPRSRS
jgi:fumarate reductase subunit D